MMQTIVTSWLLQNDSSHDQASLWVTILSHQEGQWKTGNLNMFSSSYMGFDFLRETSSMKEDLNCRSSQLTCWSKLVQCIGKKELNWLFFTLNQLDFVFGGSASRSRAGLAFVQTLMLSPLRSIKGWQQPWWTSIPSSNMVQKPGEAPGEWAIKLESRLYLSQYLDIKTHILLFIQMLLLHH